MKILRSWLNDYIETDLSDTSLADRLSLTGTSVENFHTGLCDEVVVVEIVKIEPHPNADRLQLATVFDGDKKMTVVCGAQNIAVGQIVPLAKIGAVLSGGKIEAAVIRGVESHGMLCAPDELGNGDDHSGIMILPADWQIGKKLNEYFGKETVYELEVTPNRGDCLSHLGVAREVAAFSDKTIKKQPIKLDCIPKNITDTLKVSVLDSKKCPQYQARVIESIEIKESPDWLKNRLSALGVKPINNVVDVTNYIMLDLGQPLHAFDFAKVGHEIVVRTAKKGEKIVALDGNSYDLDDSMLVISSQKEAIAIAGVMGGSNSEIDKNTKTIVLESALFGAKNIRQTSKKLGLSTEASYRYERNVDPAIGEYALNKAASMIAEMAGGKILTGISRQISEINKKTVRFEPEKINKLLGTDLSDDKIKHILKLLGFENSGDQILVPTWRHDINSWQDITEEVGRIYGYENIIPIKIDKVPEPKKSIYYYTEHLKDLATSQGFSEICSYPFLSENDIKISKQKTADLLEVINPMQPENKYLRTSLIQSLLKIVAKNSSFDTIKIYEIAKTYTKKDEVKKMAMVVAGKNAETEIQKIVKDLAEKAGIKNIEIKNIEQNELNLYKIRKSSVCVFEVEISDSAKKYLKNNDPKLKVSTKNIHYRTISKYPSLTRDLAFIVNKKVSADEIVETIYKLSEQIIRVELFDEFISDKFGTGNKNVAFHIYLQFLDRTMTDAEADKIIKSIIKTVENNFHAKLRA